MNPARRALRLVATVSLTVACGGGGGASEAPLEQCSTGVAVSGASASGRHLLGLASRYPGDGSLAAREDELRTSQRARRAAAWDVIARVLAPVPVGDTRETVPRFRTWYDREDLNQVFQRVYGRLSPADRAARAPFAAGALDEAFGWNVRYLDTLDTWDAARWQGFSAAALTDANTRAGIAGLRRIAVSPDAARHLVDSYAEVLRCIERGAPSAVVDATRSTQQAARAPLSLTPCASQMAGPFYVASGATITARVEGADAAKTHVRVSEGGTEANAVGRCHALGTQGCTVTGPGVFFVRASADREAVTGTLDVRYAAPDVPLAACLRGVFPLDAATVAMEWRRVEGSTALPTYDTSGPALARRLASGTATWGPADGTASPTASSIYTMRLENGATFQLAGMHIRTRELSRWMNITMWWSPTPDTDFGADRAASVRALGGPWGSYKMCASMDFTEGDGDPGGGFDRDAPTLAASLRAVHEGRGGPTWCSNPYIDGAPGLVRSNCVGCHQHAMSGLRPGETVVDERNYTHAGRAQVRNNFPSDQFWGLDGGDSYATVFAETVSWWAATR